MSVYYNEFDPKAAAWLRALMAEGLIPKGEVDERSIVDVRGTDLAGFTQCHFFAGIGGWAEALRLAGWGDRPVWTGSCPCQPFSESGKKAGFSDKRHLWPYWESLIGIAKPPVVFGEQVESEPARAWLDLVHSDMEDHGYAFASGVLPAASVGAPQGRHRIWFVADADHAGWERGEREGKPDSQGEGRAPTRRESLRSVGGHWPPGPGEVQSIPLSPNGVSDLMGRCRGYGNAIVPQVAAEFVAAFMEAQHG